MQAGRIAVAAVFGAGLALALAAMPKRYEVAGISMAPGLLPGDVVGTEWLPFADRWRKPRRWERWVTTLPDGSIGVKRVVGLPGETVSIEQGDLAIDGEIDLKDPRALAEIGSMVSPPTPAAAPTTWSWPPTSVLDEAPFAPDEPSRLLLPVRDVGFAAVVRVAGAGGARARSRCGPLTVAWRLGQAGRFAIIAGRLDGRAVAAAWRVPEAVADPWLSRSCLPVNWPMRWTVAEAWPTDADQRATQSPALALDLDSPDAGSSTVIEQVAVWRDVLYRPPATGTTTWQTERERVFLLGDFPPASRDSRHFGTLPNSALRHRLPAMLFLSARRSWCITTGRRWPAQTGIYRGGNNRMWPTTNPPLEAHHGNDQSPGLPCLRLRRSRNDCSPACTGGARSRAAERPCACRPRRRRRPGP